jgi:hypothetical protein
MSLFYVTSVYLLYERLPKQTNSLHFTLNSSFNNQILYLLRSSVTPDTKYINVLYCSQPSVIPHSCKNNIFFPVNCEISYLKIMYIMYLTRYEKYAHHLFLDTT